MFESFGISQLSTLRWSFFQDVIRSAALGCNSIGVWRSKVDELGTAEAVDLLFEMKLSVSSLSWCGGFTGSEGGSFAIQVDDALEAIQQAAAFRADCLIVQPGALNGHIQRHARRLLDDAMRILLPVAEDYGVRLALEPMPASSWTMLNGLADVLSFCEHYPKHQLGIVWDLGHLGMDRSAWERLPQIVDRVAVVQLADQISQDSRRGRCEIGQGTVPIRAWLQQFQKSGYRGAWEIEAPLIARPRPLNACPLEQTVESLRVFAAQPAMRCWPSER